MFCCSLDGECMICFTQDDTATVDAYAGADAKQRCLPELHDVPYDTPPPTGAAVGGSASNNSVRRSHHELMDEPIYANAAAHPPIIGNQ